MNTKTSRKVLAIAFLTTAVVLAATSAAAAATPLGSGDWAFSTTLRVSENSGTTLHEYPILVNLSGENFPTEAKTDGGDLRFSFAGQELNYWLEEFDGVEKRGAVWVRVPVLPAGESVFLKMRWGNPAAASESKGNAVFEFFDNFSSPSSLNNWQGFSWDRDDCIDFYYPAEINFSLDDGWLRAYRPTQGSFVLKPKNISFDTKFPLVVEAEMKMPMDWWNKNFGVGVCYSVTAA
ncbi:MAG: DUF2341 domain-containing protein [Candidatus Methanospirareceae archaeon]